MVVIPVVDDLQVAKAGIQEVLDNNGFPPSRLCRNSFYTQ